MLSNSLIPKILRTESASCHPNSLTIQKVFLIEKSLNQLQSITFSEQNKFRYVLKHTGYNSGQRKKKDLISGQKEMVATNKNMTYFFKQGFHELRQGTHLLISLRVAKQNYTHIFYKIVEKKHYHRFSIYKQMRPYVHFLNYLLKILFVFRWR